MERRMEKARFQPVNLGHLTVLSSPKMNLNPTKEGKTIEEETANRMNRELR